MGSWKKGKANNPSNLANRNWYNKLKTSIQQVITEAVNYFNQQLPIESTYVDINTQMVPVQTPAKVILSTFRGKRASFHKPNNLGRQS